jgi:nitrate reductase NapAB chaperone NapD
MGWRTDERHIKDTIGLIVQTEEGASAELALSLAMKAHVSIHGVVGNRIALLMDTDDIHVIANTAREIQALEAVISVHPIFSRDSLPF